MGKNNQLSLYKYKLNIINTFKTYAIVYVFKGVFMPHFSFLRAMKDSTYSGSNYWLNFFVILSFT